MKKLLLSMFIAASLMAADVTGKWTGTFTPEGQEPKAAVLVLKQEGTKVTGSGGPSADEQYDIKSGSVENGTLTFQISAGEAIMTFVLKHEGDEIKGDMTREQGDQKQMAKLAVKREK